MRHFYTDSFPMRVKRISCDAEIGSYKRGWHVCNAKAVIEAESRVCAHMWVHYCVKHAERAKQNGMRNITAL